MSFSKIIQVFCRTVFSTHFVTPRVQRLRSSRSYLFQLSFSRTYNTAYWELYEENECLKREIEMLDKFKAFLKAKQRKNWKSVSIDWDHFDEIVNRGCTFIDKTSLIVEFIEDASLVSLIVRPRRYGKTTNLTMLKEFFSIPIYPDNENYRYELFRDTKIAERSCLFESHFCKYPVIFLSLKGFDDCDTWLKMEALLCHKLALLYQEHEYIYDILNGYEKLQFNNMSSGKMSSGDFEYVYKDNEKNLEKALLVGAKPVYLSGINNLMVYPMYVDKYATQFGFTEDEISILLQHYDKKKWLNEVKE
ncbi:1513_t:CDS:2, partial [Gigaspora rosea]